MGELSGQCAVVTGASSGIGRAIALELARAGATLIVHARRSVEATWELIGEIQGFGGKAGPAFFDLADTAQQDALVETCWSIQPVDIWINNAGVDTLTGANAKLPFEQKLELLWKVDVTATMRLSRQVGARMKERGCGVIINQGWDQALHGMGGESGELYAAVKGAVMAFSRSLAISLAPQVRVNCLAPGWIKTSWGEKASQGWQARARRESLLARWGTPEDVAHVARFLASPAASFITGQIVPVNGGFRYSPPE